MSKLLLELNTFYDEDNGDNDSDAVRVRNQLMEAEKLKQYLINNYKQYLDGKYVGLTLKKLQIVIDGFNSRMNAIIERKQKQMITQIFMNNNFLFLIAYAFSKLPCNFLNTIRRYNL